MGSDWNLEESQVLLYISNKNKDFKEIDDLSLKALKCWQDEGSVDAKRIVVYLLQNSDHVSEVLVERIIQDLAGYLEEDSANTSLTDSDLALLEACGKLKNASTQLMDNLWNILSVTEDTARADKVSHIICLILPSFSSSPLRSGKWWPAIVSCINKTTEKTHVSAALRAWLGCVCHKFCDNDIRDVVSTDGVTYFGLLEPHVATASKFAVQILENTFMILDKPVVNEIIQYDPHDNACRDAWRRYTSLIEVMGIDTSVHQTMGSLSDFAALLGDKSPITSRWIIAVINVGLCTSNTEGIRVLTMELVMSLKPSQMKALVLFPEFVARVLFPKILQTPNFVVIQDLCIHSDHFERFSRNLLTAYLEFSDASLIQLIDEISTYFMEHCHCFEAPRALFTQAMLDVLPANSLPIEILNKLLTCAEATNMTYNSKAMAELYLDLTRKLKSKLCNGSYDENEQKSEILQNVINESIVELEKNGCFNRETYYTLKNNNVKFTGNDVFTSFDYLINTKSPSTLIESTLFLQASALDGKSHLYSHKISEMLEHELSNPKAMPAKDRFRLSNAVELAFDFLDSSDFSPCEMAFNAFSEVPTRLSALKAFKRSHPKNVPLDDITAIWTHLKDATLRFIDRELHLEFIDLITTPGAIADPPTDICIEIVDMSLRRRNLLTPLTVGLYRFINVFPQEPWVHVVMARIFTFMKSQEYTVRFEEIIANRYGIYEEKWGRPESHGRALAAHYLKTAKSQACGDAVVRDTIQQADFSKQITGSLDNPEAHLRVLYCQIFIIVQEYISHDMAMEILDIITSTLEVEANPPVRMHAEWLIGVIASTHIGRSAESFKDFILAKINELDGGVGTPPRVLSSHIRICLLLYYMQFSKFPGDSKEVGQSLVEHLLPLATSNKAVLRHRSISALYIISQRNMAPEGLKSIVETCARINTAAVVASSHQNESYLWDITDTRLGPVCGGICSSVFDRYMPQTLLQSDFTDTESIVVDLTGISPDADMNEVVGPCWAPENIVSKGRSEIPLPDLIEAREKVVADAVKQGLTAEFSSSMQTKSGNFDVEYNARRTELVVVATLCDKPVNLGAICRLSDALGAKSLTVKDISVLGDQHFKSTALTAEKWIPIEEVREQDLSDYLLKMKSEGYSLIGIEQTDTSKVLGPTLQFPPKTLLMMGHEKQGIPAELLALLDSCIEIEQLGYVRSMNIQTATAVVVHAYNHQHEKGVSTLQYV